MLNLSNNRIKDIEGISHLNHLAFLDLSSNLIELCDNICLPSSLIILRLSKNPILPETYRKPLVMYLNDLTELDKIKVVQAERLWYRGLLPKALTFNVQKNL